MIIMPGPIRKHPMSLTKDEIVEAVAEETDFLKNRSAEIVESLIEVIKRSLESGEDVLISSFGKFCVKEKHERKGRNPATGKDVKIEARRVVAFKCSGKLRQKINK
jgi:integration host factor subunit alpha